MKIQLHKPRVRTRLTRVLTALALTVGALGIGVLGATAASADATVQTLVKTPMSWGPYLSSPYGSIDPGLSFTIKCYVTGDTVSGPYGSENVWDMESVGGDFVPDADVYTGSNSPVVPHCSTALGQIIGDDPVKVLETPGSGQVDSLNLGEKIEIQCYTTSSTSVPGPYGPEDIWDLLTIDANGAIGYMGPMWVPDALVYTGSNSAVVPHC